jgi:hypothetical protein
MAFTHWIRRRDEYKYRAAVAATVGRVTAYPDSAKEWGRHRMAGPTIPLTTLMSAAYSEEEDAPGPCHNAVGAFASLCIWQLEELVVDPQSLHALVFVNPLL